MPERRDQHAEQHGDDPAPDRVDARPEQVVDAARVARGQGARVAELGEGGALGRLGVERPIGGLRLDGVGDEGADLALELRAVAARDVAQDRPDVAIGEGGRGRGGHAVSPWSRPRIEASSRFQSATSSAASRSPSALVV